MKYPQSFIEEIRARVRVSEVVGKAIPIRRAGREFHALCPFHKEKTPSFTINDEKGFYHCFGCGAHGDVIGFTIDYEHLRYPEAVEKLAGMAGLQLPKLSKEEYIREQKTLSLQQVVETVTAWFEEQLENTPEGQLARDYLQQRGLTPETRARFRLGYAPADRDALMRAMKLRNITEAQLIETGMLIQVEGRAPYGRFRRRLMFPIRDRKSRVIAFGGRVLPNEPNADAPKYLNSPETALFHKGRQLYNIDLARRAAFDVRQLIVAEGYMDVIALAQAGIAHAVAPLGTAITAEQLQMCWQLVDTPTLCLDGDNAGQRAMTRAMDLALPLLVPGKTLNIAVLSKGDDPDSLIKSQGREAFDAVMASAQPLAGVVWQQVMQAGAATPEARAAQEQSLMQKVGGIKHPTVQHYYKQFMRDKLREVVSSRGQGSGRGNYTSFQQRGFKKDGSPRAGALAMTEFLIPPPVRLADTNLQLPATNLIALVMAWPQVLADGAAEEFWLCAPMPADWQQQLHHLITELHIDTPELSAEALTRALAEETSATPLLVVQQAMAALGVEITQDEMLRSGRVQRLWPEVIGDVDRARLKVEITEAEKALASDMSEENFTRLTQFKAQLEALERERSRFYQQDPLTASGA